MRLCLSISMSLSMGTGISMSIGMDINDWISAKPLPLISYWANYLHGVRTASGAPFENT